MTVATSSLRSSERAWRLSLPFQVGRLPVSQRVAEYECCFVMDQLNASGWGETAFAPIRTVLHVGQRIDTVRVSCFALGVWYSVCLHKASPYSFTYTCFHSNPLPIQDHAKTSRYHTSTFSKRIVPPIFSYQNKHNGAPPYLRSHQDRSLFIDAEKPYRL